MRKTIATAAAALIMLTGTAAIPASAATPTKSYRNCTALNKVYKHGVGKPGAKDRTSGKRVTNYKRSTSLYNQNSGLDRDKDKIACEKR